MKEKLSVTNALNERMIGAARDILERRHPGENLNRQMIKSPDILLAGALASGAMALTIVPVEVAVDTAISLARLAKRLTNPSPPE